MDDKSIQEIVRTWTVDQKSFIFVLQPMAGLVQC